MKLFAVDMDGTCLDGHSRLSDENLQALRQAAQAGIQVVPTTGRSLSCLPHRLREEGFFRYVISSNGAVVTDRQTGETLFQALIPRQRALELVRQADRLPVGITAHLDNEYLVQGRALSLLGRLAFGPDARSSIRVEDMAQAIANSGKDVEEIQLYFLSRSAQEATRQMLARCAPDCLAAFTGQYVEIFSQNASKGIALAHLAQRLGIAKEEVACIGDGENDLHMFQAAGLRFAVGSGVPELKQQADVVVAANGENGVAQAVREYLLKERR